MNHNYKTRQELLDAQSAGKKFMINGHHGNWNFDLPVERYTLVEETTIKKRKHADVIIAWANGEDVQVLGQDWCDVSDPFFAENSEYRVKPKEDTKYYVARSNCLINSNEQDGNVKMTFCGSTGDLVSVEKIK